MNDQAHPMADDEVGPTLEDWQRVLNSREQRLARLAILHAPVTVLLNEVDLIRRAREAIDQFPMPNRLLS